jgi:DNA topoisomerase-1
MARLRRIDCSGPGIRRRRRGRGFEYLDSDGNRVTEPEVLDRIRELAIPPAWGDVWICPYPMGHIQATGVDAAGRKQYVYHQRWRDRRDQEKFDSMVEFAKALPRMRKRVARDLAHDGMTRDRVLAGAVRLLDRGFFRIGGEDYAADNESYGLATMHKRHVTLNKGSIMFDYPRRGGGGPDLLAYKDHGRWRDVRSEDINEYVKRISGRDFTAKDFRTWNATLLAAVALAVSGPAASGSKTARKRAMTRAVKEVAHYLGNTPAVCRASYIDPRIFDRFESGLTIGGVLPEIGDEPDLASIHGAVEEAVLDLIERDMTPAIEKVA